MTSTSSHTSNNNTTCSICYDTIQTRGKLNCCDHFFCFSCIETWSKNSSACPLCKCKFRSITKMEDGKPINKTTVPKRQFHHEYDAEYYGIPEQLLYGGDEEFLDELDELEMDENGNLLGFVVPDEDIEEEDNDYSDLEEEPEVIIRNRRTSNGAVILSDSEDEEEEEEPEANSLLYDEPEDLLIPIEEEEEEEEEDDEIDPQLRYFYEEAEEADSEEERQMEEETNRRRRRLLETEEAVERVHPQFRRVPDRRRSRIRSQVIELDDSQLDQHPVQTSSLQDDSDVEIIPTPVYTSPIRRRLVKRKKLNNTKVIELDKTASSVLDDAEEDEQIASSSSSDTSRTTEEEEEVPELEVSPVNTNGKSTLGKRKQTKKTQIVDLSDDDSDTEVLDVEIIRKSIQHAKDL